MFPLFKKRLFYFPGCFTSAVTPHLIKNYTTLFDRLRIPYTLFNAMSCCGAVALHNGYRTDFEDIKSKNSLQIQEHHAKTFVTNCGMCLQTLALHYGVSVTHVSHVLAKHIHKFSVKYEEEATFYDAAHLPFYDEPRHILESIGFDVIDLAEHHDHSPLCGCEGGLIQNTPGLAKKMAQRVFDLCTTKKLIVMDPLAYYHLKKHAPKEITVLELSEVLL